MRRESLAVLVLVFCLGPQLAPAQDRGTIYFFSGQGADKRLFDSLDIDPSFKKTFIEYGTPERKISLKEFAVQHAQKIDTTENYFLVGVSLGGMMCAELNEILDPEKTVIISSCKNRKELPFRYRFMRFIPLNEIIPAFVQFAGAKILQPVVEPDSRNNREVFKSMMNAKSPRYIKRTVRLIIRWERRRNDKDVVHIHGDNDHTLPLRNIRDPDFIIENGSHMMTLTRAREISQLLNEILLGEGSHSGR